MSKSPSGFRKKHKRALKQALTEAGATAKVGPAMDWIQSRVRDFRASGAKPSRSALVRLDLEFELSELCDEVRGTIEYMGFRRRKRVAEAIGFGLEGCRTLGSQRRAGEEELDVMNTVCDRFAALWHDACDWTTQEVWLGKKVHDEAVRRLASDVAADWKWATGIDLPNVKEDSDLWGMGKKSPPHPLWIAFDAAKFRLSWRAVRVLNNYALRRWPSAGGQIGLWTLNQIVPELAARFPSSAENRLDKVYRPIDLDTRSQVSEQGKS